MRATYIYGAGDVRVVDVPDPGIQQPTDALVRVVHACVCGSDLHPYHSMPNTPAGATIGHEFIGVVEEVGRDVTTVAKGDFVIAPFAVSCGHCEFCRAGLQTSCINGGFWNDPGLGTGGGQAEAVRVPLADGTLVTVPDRRGQAGRPAHPLGRLRHRLARRGPRRRDPGRHRHRHR
jgi:threonine dehydrogenase-like Zn-dependent dehydrogenase